MRCTAGLGISIGLLAMGTAGCRSSGEGSPAGDIAAVSADVADRTGTATVAPGQEADARAACRGLLGSPLTEEKAVKIALLSNPAVWGSYERLGIARADLLQAGETDGGPIPEAGQWPETTVLVPVGSTRTIEFVATHPGDWALHCHMTHHTMNQMGHDIPNLVGVDQTAFDEAVMRVMGAGSLGHEGEHAGMPMDMPKNSISMMGSTGPFGYITMGGMFTVVKVREGLKSYDDPGEYAHPEGTVASPAVEEDLRRDGVDVNVSSRPEPNSEPTNPAPPEQRPPGHHEHK